MNSHLSFERPTPCIVMSCPRIRQFTNDHGMVRVAQEDVHALYTEDDPVCQACDHRDACVAKIEMIKSQSW